VLCVFGLLTTEILWGVFCCTCASSVCSLIRHWSWLHCSYDLSTDRKVIHCLYIILNCWMGCVVQQLWVRSLYCLVATNMAEWFRLVSIRIAFVSHREC